MEKNALSKLFWRVKRMSRIRQEQTEVLVEKSWMAVRTSSPHGVRQRQDAQSKEVDRQKQVDVLLRKHL